MSGSLEDIHVLHVDDEPDIAAVTAEYLEQAAEEIRVTTVSGAREGCERLASEHFDCIVSDYEMPEMDGIEFLATVRADHPSVPFILYTGKGSEEVASEAVSEGVSDYLQKEVGTSQYDLLANRIRNAVTTRRAQERAGMYLDAVPSAVFVVTTGGTITRANPQVEAVFGYDPTTLLDESVEVLLPGRFMAAIVDERGEVVTESTGVDEPLAHFGQRADGSVFDAEVSIQPVPVGGDVELVVSVRDVTSYRNRERELEQYERVIANAPVGIFRLDDEFRIVYENPRAEEIVGLPDHADESAALGEDIRKLPPIVESGVADSLARLADGESVSLDVEYTSIYGKETHLSGRCVPLLHEGDFDGAVLLIEDVTEEKARDRTLQNERDRLRALFHNNSQSIARYEFQDGEPIVEEVNPAFERVFGCRDEAVRGTPLDDVIVPPAYVEEGRAINERVLDGEIVDVDVEREAADGLRYFNLRSVPLSPGESGVEGFAIYTDVTDRVAEVPDGARAGSRDGGPDSEPGNGVPSGVTDPGEDEPTGS